jgi:hypothetical protein
LITVQVFPAFSQGIHAFLRRTELDGLSELGDLDGEAFGDFLRLLSQRTLNSLQLVWRQFRPPELKVRDSSESDLGRVGELPLREADQLSYLP